MNRLLRIIGVLIIFLLVLTQPKAAQAQTAQIGTYGNIPAALDAVRSSNVTSLEGTYYHTDDVLMVKWVENLAGGIPGKTTMATDPNILREMNRKSALGGAVSVGLAMYANPPADLALWIRDTGQTLGFIPKQAYAQGVGFSGLSPLLPLWKAFRNIAYLLLALALIAVGFMVMLRQKIDPKTVVTVQNALPKIVVTLILITFSYAIVGLMIDLMYVVMFVFALALKQAGNSIRPDLFGADIPGTFVTTGGFQLWNWVFGGGFKALRDVLVFLNPLAQDFFSGQTFTPGAASPDFFTAAGTGLQVVLYGVEGILLTLVFAILLLVAIFRILGMLVGAYIQVIISVIFGPLQLLLDAFPGGEGFSSWFRNLVANLLVFPITALLFMIVYILGAATVNPSQTTAIWSPPMLFPGGQFGLTGVIGIGMLLAIPKLVGTVKEAFKAKPAVGFGIGGGAGGAMQLLSSAYYLKALAPTWVTERLFGKPGGKE